MQNSEIKKIIEALLFSSPEPLTQAKVNGVFNPDTPNLKEVVEALNKQYAKEDHALRSSRFLAGINWYPRQNMNILFVGCSINRID